MFYLRMLLLLTPVVQGSLVKYTGMPDEHGSAQNNTDTLNAALASLVPGDRFIIPNRTYWLAGGVASKGLINNTIQLDGTLKFLAGREGWQSRFQPISNAISHPILIHFTHFTCL